MNRFIKFISLLIILLGEFNHSSAQEKKPDTVKAGIYITSIHNIDFKEKEYTIDFWLWLKYKNKKFDFEKYLEIPQAKSFEKLFSKMDSSNEVYALTMKVQCVMKDNWKTDSFPFDKQMLRLSIENSQFNNKELVFTKDTLGEQYDDTILSRVLNPWVIDRFYFNVGKKAYYTLFGVDNDEIRTPIGNTIKEEYSSVKIKIIIKHKKELWLFLKLFLGMYLAFFIAYVCLFIHSDNIDSRFGLCVGALFAVIGNKYIIDSSLPETTSFNLVDILHQITLFVILAILIATIYSLKLIKTNKIKVAIKFDKIIAIIIIVIYLFLNLYFIYEANQSRGG